MKEKLGDYINEYQDIFFNEKKNNFEIYNAYNINYEEDVILKLIKKEDCPNYDLLMKNLKNQKDILNLCKSENIQNLYRYFETENYVILEEEGYDENLHQYIMNNGPSDSEKEFFKSIALGLGRALEVLYNNKVMHRNIKSSNVFLTKKTGEYSIKLGEFSNAIFIRDNISESLNSYYYAAPEIINGENYDEKCDIWSYGIVLYDLYFGDLPYGYKPSKNKIIKAISDENNFIIKETGIPTLDKLFKYTLKINPNERYSHQQVLDLIFSPQFMTKEDYSFDGNENLIDNNDEITNYEIKKSFNDITNEVIIKADDKKLFNDITNDIIIKADDKKSFNDITNDVVIKCEDKKTVKGVENLISNNDSIIKGDKVIIKIENENKINSGSKKIKRKIIYVLVGLVCFCGLILLAFIFF